MQRENGSEFPELSSTHRLVQPMDALLLNASFHPWELDSLAPGLAKGSLSFQDKEAYVLEVQARARSCNIRGQPPCPAASVSTSAGATTALVIAICRATRYRRRYD